MIEKSEHALIDAAVGATLRRLRRERGISQTQLAEALGLNAQQIQRYERGANRISASTLILAASALGVAPSDLLPNQAGSRTSSLTERLMDGAPGGDELLDAFKALKTPAERRSALRMMRSLGHETMQAADDEG